MTSELNTQEKILHFGKQEFLQNGFQGASLRNIAAAAGVTTGAIYTYFKDKNALFEAIVAPVCKQVDDLFTELSGYYYNKDHIVTEITKQHTIIELHRIYRIIYDSFDIFRLLVVCSEGSSKAGFIHAIVDHEVALTLDYLEKLARQKGIRVKLSPDVLHIVSESYINTVLEPVRHNMTYEEAIKHLDFLAAFYTGGWKSVFDELFSGNEE